MILLSKADLSDLKLGLLALLFSLALGGSLFYFSADYQRRAMKEHETARQQLNDARSQLAAAVNDRENMATYAAEYNRLLAQKVIGEEQRLDWIEGLEKLREDGRVLDFTYAIAPQQSYTPAPPLDAGNFQLNRSSMTMQLDLLHAGQLLRLFDAMRKQMKGWFMLDGCTLYRTDPAGDVSPLKAECSGGWFTMKNRNAP